MEDTQIIELFNRRDERAIHETQLKYGAYCRSIAINILTVPADAEECVSDTYLRAWNSIPPENPVKLGAWLGRVVRNIAINLWNKNHRQKRNSGLELLLSELEDCIPSAVTPEHQAEERELTELLNRWLTSLPKDDRRLFLRRYWNGEAVKSLAKEYGTSQGSMAKKMYKLRQNLKQELEKEGYLI